MDERVARKIRQSIYAILASVGIFCGYNSFPAPIDSIPVHEILRAPKEDVLASVENGGEVTYAYKADIELIRKDEDIEKRTQNSYTIRNANGSFTAHIFSGSPQFYKEDNGIWRQVEYATTTKESFDAQISALWFVKNTYAQFFSESGDGSVLNNTASPTTWATNRAATSGSSNTDTGASYQFQNGQTFAAAYNNDRIFLPFNTGDTIAAGSTIVAATTTVTVTASSGHSIGTDDIALIETSQAGTTALENTDFDNLTLNTPTEGASRFAADTDGGTSPMVFVMNASGLGFIKRNGEASTCGGGTGYTCLGLRGEFDVDNSAPVFAVSGFTITIAMSETAGTGSDPKLEVTYTPPVASQGGQDAFFFD